MQDNKLYKISLLVFFCISSILLKAQSPPGLPLPNSPTGYYNLGWVREDSGHIFSNRQPNFTPLYPFTTIGYLRAGVDTALWMWTGQTWEEIGKSGGIVSLTGVSPIVFRNDSILCPTCAVGGGITQLTGDGTAGPGSGSQPFTLNTVNATTGVFGSASSVGEFTANGKGLITLAGSVPIQIAESQVTNLASDLASKQATITLGSTSQYFRGDLSLATFPTNLSSFTNGPGYITGNQSITLSGAATGSGTTSIPVTLVSTIAASSCTNCNLSFNAAGQLTSAANGSSGGAQNLTYAQLATNNTLSISGGNSQTFLTATDLLSGLLDTARAKTIDSIHNRTFTWPVGSISNSDGTLTISPTTGAVIASLALGHANTWTALQTYNNNIALASNITFGTDNTYAIGTPTVGANAIYSRNVESDGILGLLTTASNPIVFAPNSVTKMTLLASGQLQLNGYTTSTSFTGTPTSFAEFDAGGNVIQTPVTSIQTSLSNTPSGGFPLFNANSSAIRELFSGTGVSVDSTTHAGGYTINAIGGGGALFAKGLNTIVGSDTVGTYTINIMDYGAVPDCNGTSGSGTDNTVALRAAVTAANASGASIFIPPVPTGSPAGWKGFRFTDSVLLKGKNIELYGAGMGQFLYYQLTDTPSIAPSILYFDNPTADAIVIDSTSTNKYPVVKLHDFGIQNISSTRATTGAGLVIKSNNQESQVYNMSVSKFYTDVNQISADLITYTHDNFLFPVQYGMIIGNNFSNDFGGHHLNHVNVVADTFATTTAIGIYVKNPAAFEMAYCSISGLVAAPNGQFIIGVYADYSNGPTSDMRITNCFFEGLQHNSIKIKNLSGGANPGNIQIADNELYMYNATSVAYPNIDISSLYNVQIHGNIFGTGASQGAFAIRADSIANLSITGPNNNFGYVQLANITNSTINPNDNYGTTLFHAAVTDSFTHHTIGATTIDGLLTANANAVIDPGIYTLTGGYQARISGQAFQGAAFNNQLWADNANYISGWTRLASGYTNGVNMYNGQFGIFANTTGSGAFTPGFALKVDFSNGGAVDLGGNVPMASSGSYAGSSMTIDGVKIRISPSVLSTGSGGTDSFVVYHAADSTLRTIGPTGGGIAGSDTWIQYNNAGNFGASTNFRFNQNLNQFALDSGKYTLAGYQMRVSDIYSQMAAANNFNFFDNAYYASGWTRVNSGYVEGINLLNGQICLISNPTGASGAFTPVCVFKADDAEAVALGGVINQTRGLYNGANMLITNSSLVLNDAIIPNGTTTDSVLVETTSSGLATVKKVAQSSIGSGSQTFQQVLTTGSTLTGTNNVTNTGQTFTWTNGGTGLWKWSGISHDTTASFGLLGLANDSSVRAFSWAAVAAKVSPLLPTFTINTHNGLYASGGDSVGLGTNPLDQNTTINTAGFNFLIEGSLNVNASSSTAIAGPALTINGNVSATTSTSVRGYWINVPRANTFTEGSSGTLAQGETVFLGDETFAAGSATTYTNAATLFINGPPAAGSNVTITNPWAIFVFAGNCFLGSNVSTFTGGSVSTTHILGNNLTGGGSAPSITAGAGAGTSPTVSMSGDDMGGTITVTTGTLPTGSATVATITYGLVFPNNSYASLYPANAVTAALGSLMVYTTGSTTNFTLTAPSAGLAAATTYKWVYRVGGN